MIGKVLPLAALGRFSGADERDTLTARQRKYASALAEGATAGQAAKLAAVSERTGRRWRQRPEIEAAVRAAQSENMALGRAVLVSGVAKCARSLISMGAGETDADAARVSACRVVLDTASGWLDLADVTARVEALEAQEGNHER